MSVSEQVVEDILDAIARRKTEALTRAQACADRAWQMSSSHQAGRLSSESERHREAAHQLRLAMDECQRIFDAACEGAA